MMDNYDTQSGVIPHTPCDDCGKMSYVDFYTTLTGMSRQINVCEHDGRLLCQLCYAKSLVTSDDGFRQMSMFGEGE